MACSPGVTIYNTALGGLFALVFALCYGRMGDFGLRTTAALLALSGIVAVYAIPNLKYPANPPSVGNPETIASRTELYFSMIALSLAAVIAAWMLRNRLLSHFGGWNAAIIAVAAYLIVVIAAALALPGVNEVARGISGRRPVAVQDGLPRSASDHVVDDRARLRRADGARGK